MPLAHKFYQDDFRVLVWKITESESFFAEQISYRPDTKLTDRIRQQMASRYLLEMMSPRFPFQKIIRLETGKLILPDSSHDFSLSHNQDYAAAIMSTRYHVGIDIEKIHERVLRVGKKFLNQLEWDWLSALDLEARIRYMTLCWSMKETVYKWWAHGAVDFAEHICISKLELADVGIASVVFNKRGIQTIPVHYQLIEGHWLTYVAALK